MTRFVDQAAIRVEAGHGGKAVNSFYRDLWTRHPLPDGGDGGRGGNVIIRANPQLTTLLDFQTQRHFRAHHGGNGSGKGKHGSRGKDCVVHVPLGTVVYDDDTGRVIQEILYPADEIIVARGGAGGIGNKARSKSSDIQVRHSADFLNGASGERRRLRFELKLVADVGIIGMPNAGKSTLIGQISGARPKVAAFPFTTTSPVLGAVDLVEGQIVAVDVPGLIEGAHRGKGLGLDFLRHIERTRVLVHLIDMAGTDGRDPAADYKALRSELGLYSPAVLKKPMVVVANKMDAPESKKNLTRLKNKVRTAIFPISAKTGEGIPKLLKEISTKLKKVSGHV